MFESRAKNMTSGKAAMESLESENETLTEKIAELEK